MKSSRTLTNEELSEKVLSELEDVVVSVCNEVVEVIDMQLRKGHNFLDYKQKEELVDHLREKANLNLTINAGIQTKDLASIDIFPRDMQNMLLDSFVKDDEPKEKESTVTISTNGEEGTTLSMEQFNRLPEFIAENTGKLKEEDEKFLAERRRRVGAHT